MTGESTSLPSHPTLGAEWSSFFGYLRKPALPDHQNTSVGIGARAISRMLTLDLAAMGVLITIAGIVMAIGLDIPQTALAKVEIKPAIIVAVVLVAPVLEEIAFRSWLTGRPRYLVAFPIAIIAGIAASMLGVNHTGDSAQSYVGFALLGGLVAWLVLAAILWKRPPMGWFRAVFPAMYWLSTIVFACIHLFNFTADNLFMLLPLVLPQFVLGMLLGYLRVHYGLWTAMGLHMIHNGLIISVVLAASALGGN